MIEHNKQVAEQLSKLLAESYTLYLKTHKYHWNVTGPMFHSLHLLFEQQYTELALAVDTIAERIRALGWKQKVGVVQFIKGTWITGERQFFKRLGEVTWHTMGEGFTWDTQDKDRDIAAAQAAFAKGREMMESGEYDLIVMDEINIAMRYDYLSVEDVIAGLDARDKRTGVILTGRDAKPALCDYADLVTEMTEVKHPFKNGIKAQRGVDF